MKPLLKKSNKYLLILLSFLCLMVMWIGCAYGKEFPSVAIPVKQIFVVKDKTGINAEAPNVNDTFHYTLQALEAKNPMPAGSKDGKLRFSLKGNQEILLDEIVYQVAGTYNYQIKQDKEPNRENYTFDKGVYHITVYVVEKNRGELLAQVVAKNSKGEKVQKILFQNTYTIPAGKDPSTETDPPEEDTAKTGDDSQLLLFLIANLMAILIAGLALPTLQRKRTEKI